MSKNYFVAPITPETIDRAYPLMRTAAPELSLEEWRRHCRRLSISIAGGDYLSAREEAALAINSQGYVKGLCFYSIHDHWFYGRLLDVPIFVVASAADAEAVGAALLKFLQGICDKSVCSGVRFWTMGAQAWGRRLDEEDIHRTDHGVFAPSVGGFAEIENALSASMLADQTVIDRLSR
jgi:hypothetical protein